MKKYLIILFVFLAVDAVTAQDLSVAPVFGDHMVLQQNSNSPVWGKARPGSKVRVTTSWDKRSYSTIAGSDGRWKVSVQVPAAGGPYEIQVSGSKNIIFRDVFAGEVWLASGQSNMYMPLKGYFGQPVEGSVEAILNAGDRQIRFINVPVCAAYKPLDQFDSHWQTASMETAGECSAAAWFFAAFLEEHLNVPVGIIHSSYGGTNVETWMPAADCAEFPEITVPPSGDETSDSINNVPTLLFNGMINPLAGYTIRGLIWYQGESNIFDVHHYKSHFKAMVKAWRRIWGEEFPVCFVQIAPYDYAEWNFFTPEYPEISAYIREAQLEASHEIPESWMAVIMDAGEKYMIHPPRKKVVGERLGMLALSDVYGSSGFEAESPEFDTMTVENNVAILHFRNAPNGLTTFGKPLTGFEIAGENRIFVEGEAFYNDKNGTITVSSRLVSNPVAVRYLFKNYADAVLFGTGGLPVSSFRTDKW